MGHMSLLGSPRWGWRIRSVRSGEKSQPSLPGLPHGALGFVWDPGCQAPERPAARRAGTVGSAAQGHRMSGWRLLEGGNPGSRPVLTHSGLSPCSWHPCSWHTDSPGLAGAQSLRRLQSQPGRAGRRPLRVRPGRASASLTPGTRIPSSCWRETVCCFLLCEACSLRPLLWGDETLSL